MTQRLRPAIDAYHGNLHLFWLRLSLHGRHSRRGLLVDIPTTTLPLPDGAPASPSSGLSDSVDAKATDCRPEVPHASSIGVGSDGRTSSLIPASVVEVASAEGREAAKERAGL